MGRARAPRASDGPSVFHGSSKGSACLETPPSNDQAWQNHGCRYRPNSRLARHRSMTRIAKGHAVAQSENHDGFRKVGKREAVDLVFSDKDTACSKIERGKIAGRNCEVGQAGDPDAAVEHPKPDYRRLRSQSVSLLESLGDGFGRRTVISRQHDVEQFGEQRLSALHKLRIDARYVDLAQIEIRPRVIAEPGEHIEDPAPILRVLKHHQRPT